MSEYAYITKCIEKIEEKLQWGDSKQWMYSHFNKLSEMIMASSGISISARTLQRLFGKEKTHNEYYNPQIATKNALAVFLGYCDWQDFINQAAPAPQPSGGVKEVAPPPVPVMEELGPEEVARVPEKLPSKRHYQWFWTAGICLLISGMVFVLAKSNQSKSSLDEPKGKFTFKAKYVKGDAPHTEIFYYDISQLSSDSVFISYDGAKELLDKRKKSVTQFYGLPGRYKVALVAGSQVLDSVNVLVTSRGWESNLNHNYQLTPSLPFERGRGRLHVPIEQIRPFIYDKDPVFWLDYRNICDFEVDGDNFMLEARIKNPAEEGGIRCFDTTIEVIGENHNPRITFVEPGCSRFVKLRFGEIYREGDSWDLSPFAHDLSQWRTIRMKVKNKTAHIFFENQSVYTIPYQQPAGKIKGFIFRFKGTGSLDYVRLYNSKNQLVYQDEFEQNLPDQMK